MLAFEVRNTSSDTSFGTSAVETIIRVEREVQKFS